MFICSKFSFRFYVQLPQNALKYRKTEQNSGHCFKNVVSTSLTRQKRSLRYTRVFLGLQEDSSGLYVTFSLSKLTLLKGILCKLGKLRIFRVEHFLTCILCFCMLRYSLGNKYKL